MALTIEVRETDHRVFRRFQELEEERFFAFCNAAAALGVRYSDFISPYMDAMLNGFQLRAWLEDIPPLLDENRIAEDQRESVLRVFEAAREASAISGYLFFFG